MSFISKTSYYQSISQSLTLKPSKRALNTIEQIKLDPKRLAMEIHRSWKRSKLKKTSYLL